MILILKIVSFLSVVLKLVALAVATSNFVRKKARSWFTKTKSYKLERNI